MRQADIAIGIIGLTSARDRFEKRLERDPITGCWNWLGQRDRAGYGRWNPLKKSGFRAHRAAYEIYKGPIPKGLTIDHLCRNVSCVNPDHLEAVDLRTNLLRGNAVSAIAARQTHCVNGHPFDLFNTAFTRGFRVCRACGRDKTARYEARRRAS
jgi:hypothetical protein